MRPIPRRKTFLIALVMVLGVSASSRLDAARIVVGTADQKISGIGPCSLQEAIYSAEFQASIAIDATDPDDFIPTNCTPGTGNDTIVLPGGVFPLSSFLDGDAYNPYGPTATPIIFSTITIEGNGTTLEWTGSDNVRLFAVGPASIKTPGGTVSGTGNLTLQNVYIKGFHVKGGDGADGGGGGMGAGGAIYIQFGSLTVENSTFDGNGANGGSAVTIGGDQGGGGGGLGGDGGSLHYGAGSGGGGARGKGGVSTGTGDGTGPTGGGGGGGIVFGGGNNSANIGGAGGYLCGGNGGDDGNDGHGGKCPGGGGGGGGKGADGAGGAYGGGGGGACDETSSRDSGGNGGFGGGGGGTCNPGAGGNGGNGGFGGGGGVGGTFEGLYGGPGSGGYGGGDADESNGGGGAAFGGAIFSDGAAVTVHNSTFTNNFASRGTGAHNGGDAGAAIFAHNGSLTVVDATVSGNEGTGSGAGIVVFGESSAAFTLDDTIVANNGANECYFQGSVTASGAGNLIMSNGSGAVGPCPGVVKISDPLLGPLQDNGGGTPTMAISGSGPAANAADPATSLPTDQRGQGRPQFGKWDIGALELCRNFRGVAPCIAGILNVFVVPSALSVDGGGSATSDNNGVLEPGETVPVKPSWTNTSDVPVALTATASGMTGPAGATYAIGDGSADYGVIPVPGTTETPDGYTMSVSAPASRPATHWDAIFTEIPNTQAKAKVWELHIGQSFTDVPKTQPFYKKIETLLHSGITAGCTGTTYCPGVTVNRGQMAIFISRGIAGGSPNVPVSGNVSGQPYNCVSGGTSLFTDVLPTDPFCKGVHYIAAKNVTSGCAASLFCPNDLVTRAQMAIFLAKTIVEPAGGAAVPETYGPDPGTGFSYSCNPASPSLHFTDVSVSDSFCRHVHFLWAKGIVSGCTSTQYCPGLDVPRDAMAKFLVNTFQLRLYGP